MQSGIADVGAHVEARHSGRDEPLQGRVERAIVCPAGQDLPIDQVIRAEFHPKPQAGRHPPRIGSVEARPGEQAVHAVWA